MSVAEAPQLVEGIEAGSWDPTLTLASVTSLAELDPQATGENSRPSLYLVLALGEVVEDDGSCIATAAEQPLDIRQNTVRHLGGAAVAEKVTAEPQNATFILIHGDGDTESPHLQPQEIPSHPTLHLVPDIPDSPAEIDWGASSEEIEQVPFEKPRAVHHLGGLAIEAADVQRADEFRGEQETLRRYRRFLGGIALRQSVKGSVESSRGRRSSLNILRDAANGNRGSFDALLTDTKTHVYEIYGGVGEGMKVIMDVADTGEVVWGGQTTEDRQHYVLTTYTAQAPAILEAVHAEGMSGFRLEDRFRDGQLAGKAVFDFSAMPDATRDELSEWGYFLNSIACSIRSTRFVDQQCEVNSVFVAGVDQRQVRPQLGETESQEAARQEQALQMRFDVKILRKMYAFFGVEGADHMSPAELLATPLVTSDEFDALDMVMLYDRLATEEMGLEEKTFFGSVELWQEFGSPERLTREHYEAHMEQREQRHKEYQSLCVDIVKEQIRRQGEASTPREAVELKRRVVLDYTVERAIEDSSIEADFGRVSNELIDRSRWAYAQGDMHGGDNLKSQAQAKAVDGSCPPGERAPNATDSVAGEDQKKECTEVKDGDKVNCPYCNEKVTARVPKKGGEIFCSNKRCDAYKPTKEEMEVAA